MVRTLYKASSFHEGDLRLQDFLYGDYSNHFKKLYKISSVVREGAHETDDITEFIQWLDTLTKSTPEQEIEQKFNIDIFLKSIALEYLICQWDGCLHGGNNYYIYRDITGYSTIFPFDFDITFW